MARDLSFTLHVLTARLDRAADRILRSEHDITYSRFLALSLIGEHDIGTQRALAEALGVTEPSVSRMIGVLTAEGLLEPPERTGRRRLSLSASGRSLVASAQGVLEDRFAELVAGSGVPYDAYREHTARLLATLTRYEDGGAR
ncbi:MAG: MarR family transcriptional regulator [Micropruina sp.]|nr:MarR family transcriptional regulator [Micropruina sp.]